MIINTLPRLSAIKQKASGKNGKKSNLRDELSEVPTPLLRTVRVTAAPKGPRTELAEERSEATRTLGQSRGRGRGGHSWTQLQKSGTAPVWKGQHRKAYN